MPSSLRIDGWFSRCRDKVQVRARAGREVTSAAPAMLKRDVPESQEPREPRAESVTPCFRESRHVFLSVTPCFRECHAMFQRVSRHVSERAICNWRVVFQQSNLLLPTGGLSNPMVRMGRSPAHVQACWVDQQFCDVSSLLGRINFMDLYTCIIMQGITI